MATYLTLSNDETFKIDNPSGKLIKHQHCDEKYSIVGTDDKDNYVYTLKYNGELYKDNIKINENAELSFHTKNLNMAEKQRSLMQQEIAKIVRKKSMTSPNGEKMEEDLENETENLIK